MDDDGFNFEWNDRNGKLEKAFWKFHDANPQVYILLVKYAREWRRTHTHCSIKLLFERVRWQMGLTIQSADGFRLNNNHHAFYARMIETQEEELRGFFRMRQQRRQCSFGPRNEGLPPGDHIA